MPYTYSYFLITICYFQWGSILSFAPLLAADIELNVPKNINQYNQLKFPLWGSPKLDGIRIVNPTGTPTTRSLKQVRNHQIVELLSQSCFQHFDGEGIAGPETASNVFQRSTSWIMSFNPRKHEPDWKLFVFDYTKDPLLPYFRRFEHLQEAIDKLSPDNREYVSLVEQRPLNSLDDLFRYEEEKLLMKYEGLIVRDPNASYKFGRSTFNEHILLKVKRFVDTEGEIIGFEEMMSNQNEQTRNELGYAERKGGSAKMVPAGILGKFVVTHPDFPKEFRVGSGLNMAQRKEIWDNQEAFLGRRIKFKYQEVGIKDLPRTPIFLGFRENE